MAKPTKAVVTLKNGYIRAWYCASEDQGRDGGMRREVSYAPATGARNRESAGRELLIPYDTDLSGLGRPYRRILLTSPFVYLEVAPKATFFERHL